MIDRLTEIRALVAEHREHIRCSRCGCCGFFRVIVLELLATITALSQELESTKTVLEQALDGEAYLRHLMVDRQAAHEASLTALSAEKERLTRIAKGCGEQADRMGEKYREAKTERDAFRDEANTLRRNYVLETRDLAERADKAELALAEVSRRLAELERQIAEKEADKDIRWK